MHSQLLNKRLHNKSKKSELSFLNAPEQTFKDYENVFKDSILPKTVVMNPICEKSQCESISSSDGRLSYKGKKFCHAYQFSALEKFGKDQLEAVPSNKTKESLTISHICGTRNCVNQDHLVLEPKTVNDERAHCHFSLKNAFKSKKEIGLKLFRESQACPHSPRCGDC